MDSRTHATILADLMDEFGLRSAELSGDGWRVMFERKPLGAVEGEAAPANNIMPATHIVPPAQATGKPITSPMVGIFYSSPSPQAPPFVKEGEHVEAGRVVALIEAMKVFNEITAPFSGRVIEVSAKSGDLVEVGQTLILIE